MNGRKTALPDALTKGDYFRNRGPSQSPNRRPPRKTQATNGETKAFPLEASKQQPNREMPRLPQINGSSANSDKGSDKSSNGDSMTGEVTLAFIDYRMDPNIKKRPADQMHNVKIIQYIGQGVRASRVNHEFWMQNETAAKFPVPQQSISSRSQLNFAFYLDGQFFYRLSVCCLNKLRTTHQIIGTKFVHFKVVDVTNIVLCFRCKGHEYMQQSFKKGSAPLRSTSLPRRAVAAAGGNSLPSPDVPDAKVLRVNGSSPLGLKRSRSISRTRTPQQQPVPPLRRTTTKTLISAGAGGGASISGSSAGKKKTEVTRSEKEDAAVDNRRQSTDRMLESYCEDRLSPVSQRRNNPSLVNGEAAGKNALETEPEKEPEEEIPQNVLDVLGEKIPVATCPDSSDHKEGLGETEISEIVHHHSEPPVIPQDTPAQGQTSTPTSLPSSRKTSRSRKPSSGIRQPSLIPESARRPLSRQDSKPESLRENSAAESPTETPVKKASISKTEPTPASQTNSRKPSSTTDSRRNSAAEVPVVEKYQNELFGGTTDSEDNNSAVINATAETVVRDATEGALAQTEIPEENGGESRRESKDTTTVRDANESPSQSQTDGSPPAPVSDDAADASVRGDGSRPATAADDSSPPRMATQPLRSNPGTPRNVDAAEDMIELGHAAQADVETGQMPVGSIVHNKKEHPQSQSISRKHSETDTLVRDATAENLPALAKEDPVAFEWPDTEGKATSASPPLEVEEKKHEADFVWPDATEAQRKKSMSTVGSARARHMSVEIMDGGTVVNGTAEPGNIPERDEEDVEKPKRVPLDEVALKKGTFVDQTDSPTTVRNDVPLDEVELKRKKSMERPSSTSKAPHRGTLGSLKSQSLNYGSFDLEAHDRRASTPHNAEEFIEQLGYAEEPRPPSVKEEESRPGTGIREARSASVTSTLPVIDNNDHQRHLPDGHIVDHVVVTKHVRPTLNHIGASQDSGANMSDVEKDGKDDEEKEKHQKPPSSPHNAGDMITQLGFGGD